MTNNHKRYALRCFIFLYVVYMAIAAFGQHQSYTQLFFGIVTGLVLFSAGRVDRGLETVIPHVEKSIAEH